MEKVFFSDHSPQAYVNYIGKSLESCILKLHSSSLIHIKLEFIIKPLKRLKKRNIMRVFIPNWEI